MSSLAFKRAADLIESDSLIAELLRWYDGNIYATDRARVAQARSVLEWCQAEGNSLVYLEPEARNERLSEASRRLDVSSRRLAGLAETVAREIDSSVSNDRFDRRTRWRW